MAQEQDLGALIQKLSEEVTEGFKKTKQELRRVEAVLTRELAEVKKEVKRMGNIITQLQAKQHNSACRANDVLQLVPKDDGSMPLITTPKTLNHLTVSGAELLPGKDSVNKWNAEQSLALIHFYEPGYMSEAEASGDEDAKKAKSARSRRLRVAQHLGITPAQLQAAAVATYA